MQGGLVTGQTEPGAKVWLNGKAVRVGEKGQFLFGFGRDYKEVAKLRVELPSGDEVLKTLKIAKRTYKTERVDGLPPSKVTPSEAFYKRI